MDFTTSSNGESLPTFIQNNDDLVRHKKIVATLCEKRFTLEEKIKDENLSLESREETALDLIQIKEDLTAFGISEIDYQTYLVSKEAEAPMLPFV